MRRLPPPQTRRGGADAAVGYPPLNVRDVEAGTITSFQPLPGLD